MSDEISNTISSNERLLSAAAHFFGFLAALVVWILQKDKSKYVRFQAVQALAFDFAAMILGVIVSICVIGVIFVGIAGSVVAVANSASPDEMAPIFMMPFMFPFVIFVCVLPFSLVLLILRTFAAASVLAGKDFRYPILGNSVEKFFGDYA